ncbi:hydantoinase/carbamoylase family amidase [Shumkonia mesophila]|uniref:hydantoinase/carbamoylase family amidase n=1 Tax=Shumkonia mesophila TaxID=2838854 RepID=UPI002934114E|nr:hydantoinase/carbamoylase family amidase [Shumkonia mesophila]
MARRLFDKLARESADPPGVTRKSYGEGERMAHALMIEATAGFGVEVAHDAAGNLFITLPGEDRSGQILVASHIDTVSHGGNYDGAAGVVAGVAAQAIFHAAGRKPPFDLTVLVMRAEESCWFPYSYLGSKSALGILDPSVVDSLKRSDTGKTLAEHMRDEGFDPEAVKRGASLIDRKRVVAYFEPHIEQAPVLVNAGIPLGVVTGIRGSFRYRNATCVGAYAHSGAMPREYRRDAAAATGEFVVRMDELWEDFLARGRDLTVTFGELMTDPQQHGFSKVAGEMHICLDVRSQDQAVLDEVRTLIDPMVNEIGERRNVRFELGLLTGSSPAVMSGPLQEMLIAAAETTTTSYRVMASGAGHDAATFTQVGIPTAMLFIRNENGSHNPDEAMDMSDFDHALTVLAETLAAPVDRWRLVRG